MSRATLPERAHDLRPGAEASAEHAPDLEAEHDPEASRRASLAGLHREAAVQRKAAGAARGGVHAAADLLGAPTAGAAPAAVDAIQRKAKGKVTEAAADKQHDAAESASFDAIQAALVLGAKQVDGRAAEIDALIESPGPGGPVRSIDLMPSLFDAVASDLRRLEIEIGKLSLIWRKQLSPEVRRLGGAVERFSKAWARAEGYAAKHGVSLGSRYTQTLWQHINSADSMYTRVDLDRNTPHVTTKDERSTDALLDAALKQSLAAIEVNAESVRMAMAAGKDGIAEQDLGKLIWHLKEVEALLRQDHGRKVGRAVAGQAAKAIKTARRLQGEISTKPALANMSKDSNLTSTLANIGKFAGAK